MQITISARHGHLSNGTQEKVHDKVQKLNRLFDRVTAVQVTVDLEHKEHTSVEIRVSVEHHDDFVATERSSELMTALDQAIPKIEQQLRKHKEKVTGHRAQSVKHMQIPVDTDEA